MIWNLLYGMVDGYHVLEQLAVSFLGQNLVEAGIQLPNYIPQYCSHNIHCSDSLSSHQHSSCNCKTYSIFL